MMMGFFETGRDAERNCAVEVMGCIVSELESDGFMSGEVVGCM